MKTRNPVNRFFVLCLSITILGCSAPSESELLRRERIASSPQALDGSFRNPEFNPELRLTDVWDWAITLLTADLVDVEPPKPLPVTPISPVQWPGSGGDGLAFAWLGHSSLLIEIQGVLVLVDPVLGERASPASWFGPKRFHPSPATATDLPEIDLVLITHDHYDHLEKGTILALEKKIQRFVVPLGIGRYLEDWGVAPNKIVELDWWENHVHQGVTVTAAPAQHYSGRASFGGNPTLWCAWALRGEKRGVYVSGDSGMYRDAFIETGARLGPFEVAFLKIGSYPTFGIGSEATNQSWLKLHMDPEQALEQFSLIGGGLLVPIHWATFNLGYHPWYEPIERLLAGAPAAGVPVLAPGIGQRITIDVESAQRSTIHWWRPFGVPEGYKPPQATRTAQGLVAP